MIVFQFEKLPVPIVIGIVEAGLLLKEATFELTRLPQAQADTQIL